MITRLACKYDAPIMPVFVGGRNSYGFYLSGLIHKRIRTFLLARAMLNKKGQHIPLTFGAPIPAQDLRRLNNDDIAAQYIRMCCKVLGAPRQINSELEDHNENIADIKPDICLDKLNAHLKTLSPYKVYDHAPFSLYCVPYDKMGPMMEQLSITREHTFRTVDEGTGQELDSDQFDPHYLHLFLWDHKQKKIAGGYRLGRSDEIVKTIGLNLSLIHI